LTIVIFSDFQCPFCSKVSGLLTTVLSQFEGEVRIVFKHFPLPFHKEARLAAEAAMAAGAQGKFWEMHDLLFRNQRSLAREDLERYADGLGLDMGPYLEALESRRYGPIIDRHMEEAGVVGVRGTPNLFFNGRKVRGAKPFAELKPLILEELARGRSLLERKVADPYASLIAEGRQVTPFDDEAHQIATDAAPAKGEGKEVEVVVFSDFQCPHCRSMSGTLDQLLHFLEGRGRIVFKNFPLPAHKQAHVAAQAALAAHAQGKFWEMHDRLFDEGRAMSREELERFAGEIGLNMEQFRKELDDGTWKSRVDADLGEGKKLGVDGAPTLFINGRKYEGSSRVSGEILKAIDKHIVGR